MFIVLCNVYTMLLVFCLLDYRYPHFRGRNFPSFEMLANVIINRYNNGQFISVNKK